jgi:hypothetical protein
MNKVIERMFEFQKEKRISSYEMSCLLGIKESGLSQLRTGKRVDTGVSCFENLILKTDVNPAWLFLGEGAMLRSDIVSGSKQQDYNIICKECEEQLDAWRSRALRAEGALDYIKMQSLPLPDPAPPHKIKVGGRRESVETIKK